MAAPGPGTPGDTGTRLAQEALGNPPGRRRRALASFSAFSFIPPKREGPPELSYFGRPHKTGDFFTYDAIFGNQEGYDQYLPRCDRRHAKGRGLKIHEEFTASFQEPPLLSMRLEMSLSCPAMRSLQSALPPASLQDEMARTVPVLTSSEYGKRVHKPLEPATGEHARVCSLHAAIYGEGSRPAR